MRDSASYLMNSEIAILFIRSAVRHSFQKNLLPHFLQKRVLVLRKRNPDSCGMGTEIAILFVRSAIKHFSSGTFCFVACQKEFSFLKKEVSILLVRAVSEIAILSIRFATKHSFQKNSLLHCLLERILVLEKRIPGSCGKGF